MLAPQVRVNKRPPSPVLCLAPNRENQTKGRKYILPWRPLILHLVSSHCFFLGIPSLSPTTRSLRSPLPSPSFARTHIRRLGISFRQPIHPLAHRCLDIPSRRPMEYLHSLSLSARGRTSQSSKKNPPLHKRHTKPCKFYQTNRCPYPSEVCNFAHVISPEFGDGGATQVCRYYSAGKCTNGSSCRYRHDADLVKRLGHGENRPYQQQSVVPTQIPGMGPLWNSNSQILATEKGHVGDQGVYAPVQPPFYHQQPIHEWSYAHGITVQSPVYLPMYANAPHHPHHAVMPLGSTQQDSGRNASTGEITRLTTSNSPRMRDSASRSDPYLGLNEHDEMLSSASSSSVSSMSTKPVLDRLIIATTEVRHPQYAHGYQGQLNPLELSGGAHTLPPGMQIGTATSSPHRAAQTVNVLGTPGGQRQHGVPHQQQVYFYVQGMAPTPVRSTSGSRSASRGSHKIKASKYKTKPCKFWNADGTCPAADECTFLHDEPRPPPVPPLPSTPFIVKYPPGHPGAPSANQKLEHSVSGDSPVNSRSHQDKLVSHEPPSPGTKDSPSVSWRVIGGGVRVANPSSRDSVATSVSSQCSDTLSIPDDSTCSSDTDSVRSIEFGELAGAGTHNSVFRHVKEIHTLYDASPTSSGCTVTGQQAEERRNASRRASMDDGAVLVRTRKRSNSIPPTPSTTQFSVGRLFSAESPAGL